MLAQTTTQAGTVSRGVSWEQWAAIAIALAVLILPFVVGGFLAKAFKMPNYGTRFGWILLAIVASTVVLLNRLPGLGIDLRGGTILVYEMDPAEAECRRQHRPNSFLARLGRTADATHQPQRHTGNRDPALW